MNHFATTQWRDLVATLRIFWKVRKKRHTLNLRAQLLPCSIVHSPGPRLMKHTLQFQIFQHASTTCFISLQRHQISSPGTPHLMSKLVAGEAKNHQAPGKATLQFVELVEVSSGCSSE